MNIFLIPSSFLFFLKNYYHFTKGMEPAQSPKPAVSLPLNPSFLGHGSGLCPKNLLSSKVISVNYEQFRVFFLHLKFFFIFFKMNIFLIPSSFPFFIKIIIIPLRTGHRSKSEGRGFKSDIFTANISSLITPSRLYQSRHNITSKS